MKKMILRFAPVLALLAATVATTPVHADTVDRVSPRVVVCGAEEGPTVQVMNNHGYQVAVYLVDSNDRRHLLGKVENLEFKTLQIPAGLALGTEAVRLKIYPIFPKPGLELGLGLFGEKEVEATAVKTAAFAIRSDHVIELFLEPDLTRSKIGIASS